MRNSTRKLLSFSLVFLMMLSLFMSSLFVQNVEAEENDKSEDILIVDGVEYDAKSEAQNTTWGYNYNEELDVVNVFLSAYSGGPIYCSKSVRIFVVEDSIIESFYKPAIESKGYVCICSLLYNSPKACNFKIVANNENNAIKAAQNIIMLANCEIISKNCPALASGLNIINFECFYDYKLYVGKNVNNAKIGKYDNQSYMKIDFDEYTVNLYGNGGVSGENYDLYNVIINVNKSKGYDLSVASKLYKKNGKVQLGWATDLKTANKNRDNIIKLNDNIFSKDFSDDNKINLYAVWGDSNDVVVQLHNLLVNNKIITKTSVYKKGNELILPDMNCVGKTLVNWHNKDRTKIYSVGEKVVLNENIELFPEFKSKKCVINGEVIKFDDNEFYSGSGFYMSILKNKIHLAICDKFEGNSIYLPGDSIITTLGNVSLVASDSSPALTVDGDLSLSLSETDKLKIVSQKGVPAIKCNGDIDVTSSIFCVGDNADNVVYTEEYNDESYIKIEANECSIYLTGNNNLPKLPEYSKKQNSVFLGWTEYNDFTKIDHTGINTKWYEPKQEVVNCNAGTSIYAVYKPCDKLAVRLYGNGGINKLNSDFSVWYMILSDESQMKISDFDFLKKGYRIKCWNTKEDGTGTDYNLNSILKKENCENEFGVIDLYAIWEKFSPFSINYEIHSNSSIINVNLNNKQENKMIKDVVENSLKNIDINVRNKAKSYNIILSTKLITTMKENCSVTINTNIGNIIIPKESFKDIDDDVNIKIKRLDDGEVSISKNIDKDIKLELLNKNANLAIKVDNNKNNIILPKLINVEGRMKCLISDESTTVKVVNKKVCYDDVNSSDWFYNAVNFVGIRQLFDVEDNMFNPNLQTNRAELVSILHKLESKPEAKECKFKDVKPEDKFAEAVAWASDNNIVKGTLKGFEPNKNITREQLCVMIYNYAKYLGLDTNIENIELSFDDNDKVASWSKNAVKWMVKNELLKGSYNKINPRGNTTNAQLATIIKRFVEMIANEIN